MCRYRKYIYSCGDAEFESPPYLPCNPEEFCNPEETDDQPINIKKSTPCPDHSTPGAPVRQNTDGGTSWSRTNSGDRGRALGPGEGNPGDRLRHTVSTKLKIVRSLTTKKHKEPKKDNGTDGFLPDQGKRRYEEVNEMDDLKK